MTLIDLLSRFFEEPGGHVVLDPSLKVCEVGPEFLRMTHQSRSEMMGTELTSLLTEADVHRRSEFSETLKAGVAIALKTYDTVKLEVMRCDVRSPEGTIQEKWWRIALIPISDETGEWVVGRFEDLSLEVITANKLIGIRRSNYILYALVIAVLALTGVLQARQSHSNHHLGITTCNQVQNINKQLYKTINGQLKQTKDPATALGKFYAHHHDLAQSAIQSDDQALKTFTPKKC